MRIAFTGPSGTGKSTLAKHVARVFDLEMCDVGSREVAKAMGFDSPYGVDAAGRRKEFQRRLLVEKTRWERNRGRFVTDRTTLDNLAYSILHGAKDLDAEFWLECFASLASYDLIFFLSADDFIQVGDDPAREKDPTYHLAFEVTLRGLYARADRELANFPARRGRPRLVQVTTADLESRAGTVERAIRYRFDSVERPL